MIHLHFHSEYNQICMSYKSPGIYPKYLASKAENPNGHFLFSLKKIKKKRESTRKSDKRQVTYKAVA